MKGIEWYTQKSSTRYSSKENWEKAFITFLGRKLYIRIQDIELWDNFSTPNQNPKQFRWWMVERLQVDRTDDQR